MGYHRANLVSMVIKSLYATLGISRTQTTAHLESMLAKVAGIIETKIKHIQNAY